MVHVDSGLVAIAGWHCHTLRTLLREGVIYSNQAAHFTVEPLKHLHDGGEFFCALLRVCPFLRW